MSNAENYSLAEALHRHLRHVSSHQHLKGIIDVATEVSKSCEIKPYRCGASLWTIFVTKEAPGETGTGWMLTIDPVDEKHARIMVKQQRVSENTGQFEQAVKESIVVSRTDAVEAFGRLFSVLKDHDERHATG